MEAKLESVLASISNPGLIAGSGGLVTDGNARPPYSTLDSGPGGAEGRGDVHVGVDPSVVASALESIRSGRSSATPGAVANAAHAAAVALGAAGGASDGRPALASRRSDSNPESAITRREPIVLPAMAHSEGIRFEGGGAIGAHAEIGPSRTGGHPVHTTLPPQHPGHSAAAAMAPSSSGHLHSALHAPSHPHVSGHSHVHFSAAGSSSSSAPTNASSVNGGGGHGPAGPRVTSAPASSAGKSSPLEWSGIKDPNAVDGSPRLHSLPDNTLNPSVSSSAFRAAAGYLVVVMRS